MGWEKFDVRKSRNPRLKGNPIHRLKKSGQPIRRIHNVVNTKISSSRRTQTFGLNFVSDFDCLVPDSWSTA